MEHMESGTFASSVLRPAKLPKLDWNTCLCHSGPVPSHEPLVAFGERSWKTLLQAANVRDDHLHAFLCGSGAGLDAPRGFYHRVCYQKYTHRHHLARLEESAGGDADGDITSEQQQSGQGTHADSELSCSGHDGEAGPSMPNGGCSHSQVASARLTRSQVTKTDHKLCLFCQQGTKKVKGSRQKPSNCMTLEACATLYEAALITEDERVLLEVNPSLPDLIAKEICYHKVCYSHYTNPKALEAISDANVSKESNGSSGSAYTRAFSRLTSEIEQSIINCPSDGNVASMPELCRRYILLLEEEGVALDSYRTYRLKHRLREHFKESLAFFRSSTRITDPEMVIATAVPQSVLLHHTAENLRTSEEISTSELETSVLNTAEMPLPRGDSPGRSAASLELYNSALYLREQVLSMKNSLPAVPTISDLSQGSTVPVALYNFLSWVLCGDVDDAGDISLERKVDVGSDETDRQVTSVAQDVIHLASKGRIRTVKHFILPMTVHHLTRSEQLITMLNRLGHGYSASRIVEVETGIAERFLNNVGPDGVFVPSNISRQSSVVFCWDNNDFMEETQSGLGTTHCTNGIVIQRHAVPTTPAGPEPPPTPSTHTQGKHRRSLQHYPVFNPQYVAGSRAGPPTGNFSYVPDVDQSVRLDRAQLLDRLYVLLRCSTTYSPRLGQPSTVPQALPPWTAFNAKRYWLSSCYSCFSN